MGVEDGSLAPVRIDGTEARVWRGDERLELTPRAFALLRYLAARPGRLVTKQELFATVWEDVVVTDGALTVCMSELRRALGDPARAPRYIESVPRRGYRFIGPVATPGAAGPAAPDTAGPVHVVGRADERRRLRAALERAHRGRRQLVFVTGEPGIGKTTLVDAFLDEIGGDADVLSAWGHCVEQHGGGEPYLPVLAALSRLGSAPEGAGLAETLRRQAPTWLAQLPALGRPAQLAAARAQLQGATRERMLRELAEALEAASAERTLVLVLEDLHWSDHATVELLSWLARRRDRARLLIVATYRPVEVALRDHPLHAVKPDLVMRGLGEELPLAGLSEGAVAEYLASRWHGAPVPTHVASAIHQRTNGLPLFVVTLAETLQPAHGPPGGDAHLAEIMAAVPDSLRLWIERQLEGLGTEDRQLLEAASVVGTEFSAAAAAAVCGRAVDGVEATCARLGRRAQFLEAAGEEIWPDGTVAARYRFRHALHHQVGYDGIPAGRRARMHLAAGTRLEQGCGGRAAEHAAELAMHFDQGRDYPRAVRYRQEAARTALGRHAYQEAIGHLSRGLELLATLPETSERVQQELDLLLALGPALVPTRGSGAPEVEQVYARARALCARVGETPQLFRALRGLSGFYFNQGAMPTALELGEQLHRLAERTAAPLHRREASYALGLILFFMGDFTAARARCEQGIAGIDPAAPPAQGLSHGPAPEVGCLALAAHSLWCQGYPAQALRRSQEALTCAQALAHPYSLAFAETYAAWLHQRCRAAPAVQAHAEALLALATAQGFPLWQGIGACHRGWALVMQGQATAGLEHLRQGLDGILAAGVTLGRTLFLLPLAEALGHAGQVAEGLDLLAESRREIEAQGLGCVLAEAYCLQGVLLLRQAAPDPAQAEACFQQALAIARRQQARSWELRAAMSLSRLWQQQGKCQAAHDVLAPVYHWFTEGFDTADLQDAKALLKVRLGSDARLGDEHVDRPLAGDSPPRQEIAGDTKPILGRRNTHMHMAPDIDRASRSG